MKTIVVGATMLAFLLGGADIASAKGFREHTGSSHAGSSTRVHAPRASRASKPKGDYVVRKCKTPACFKKHPGGTYGFYAKPKG